MRHQRVMDRPGRVAAIGGAAVICVLSVSGALGISPTGTQAAGQTHHTGSPAGGGGAGSEVLASDRTAGGSGTSAGQHESGSPTQGDTTPTQPQRTALPANSGTGKRIVFDVGAQRVWLVAADNSVERTYPVSGSKFHNLDNGTYHVTSRSRHATAYNSAETMSYMVRFAMGRTSPIGFHSIPKMPDGTLVEDRATLGTPQSDGCIRQWISDARALWDFAPDRATVVVRG